MAPMLGQPPKSPGAAFLLVFKTSERKIQKELMPILRTVTLCRVEEEGSRVQSYQILQSVLARAKDLKGQLIHNSPRSVKFAHQCMIDT